MKARLLFLAVLLLAPVTNAGSLSLRDDDKLVPSPASLEAVASLASFDTVVIVSSERGHGATFDRYIDTIAPASNNIVIGVDPQGHHTHIWAGNAIGIPSSVLGSVAISANQYFRASDWAGGVAEMTRRLVSASRVAPVAVAQPAYQQPIAAQIPAQQPIQAPINWVSVFGYTFAFAMFAAILLLILRAQKKSTPEPTRRRPISDEDYTYTPRASAPSYERVAQPTTGAGTIHPGIPTPYVPMQPTVIVQPERNHMLDYMVMDSVLNHSHRDQVVVVQPPPAPAPVYVAPEPAYVPRVVHRQPDPEPSSSGSSWGGSASSGGSDWGSSSSDSGSSSSGGDSGSSGGSDW